jgi:hypothetical protein
MVFLWFSYGHPIRFPRFPRFPLLHVGRAPHAAEGLRLRPRHHGVAAAAEAGAKGAGADRTQATGLENPWV